MESGTKSQATTKTTYKLPKGKAAAVAGFLKENVKGAKLETKVDGDSLIVTASSDAQKAIASDSLMQEKDGKRRKIENNQRSSSPFKPDGKNDSASRN